MAREIWRKDVEPLYMPGEDMPTVFEIDPEVFERNMETIRQELNCTCIMTRGYSCPEHGNIRDQVEAYKAEIEGRR